MDNNRKRILVVDDEVSFTKSLKLNLEQTDHYEVCLENDPVGALTAAERFKPDLILLDVMMPGMDGGELAAQFQSHALLKSVPIVFLTAAVRRTELKATRGLIGGLPFLAKPVDLSEVIRCFQAHLGPWPAPVVPPPSG